MGALPVNKGDLRPLPKSVFHVVWVRLFKDFLVLFILCLDQPGFTLCWVELARAYLGFGWFNEHLFIWLYFMLSFI
jgi:hypothetical protein